MKEYLKAAIIEQINRGLYLKRLIPHPLKYSELSSLADRCSRIIDDNIEQLKYLLQELDGRDKNDIKDVYRGFRICVWQIERVEYFGITALYYQTPEIEYLNKLIFKIHREINLPLTPPSVACISNDYYYFHNFTNIIFVPIGESNFLLHLPDVFHEIGHEVLYNKDKELRLEKVNECYLKAINVITTYYRNLLTRKMHETGPEDIPRAIMHIHSQWKDYWIEEFFSDLFACYTLGPAYVWAHLHLTAKKSEDIYRFSTFLPQRHPSDDSRMKMLITALNNLGFKKEAISLLSKWNNMPFAFNIQPVVEYQYAYPENLIKEIANIFLEGLKESSFSVVTPESLNQLDQSNIIKLLNEAWKLFWSNPDTFRHIEEESIKKLKSVL